MTKPIESWNAEERERLVECDHFDDSVDERGIGAIACFPADRVEPERVCATLEVKRERHGAANSAAEICQERGITCGVDRVGCCVGNSRLGCSAECGTGALSSSKGGEQLRPRACIHNEEKQYYDQLRFHGGFSQVM